MLVLRKSTLKGWHVMRNHVCKLFSNGSEMSTTGESERWVIWSSVNYFCIYVYFKWFHIYIYMLKLKKLKTVTIWEAIAFKKMHKRISKGNRILKLAVILLIAHFFLGSPLILCFKHEQQRKSNQWGTSFLLVGLGASTLTSARVYDAGVQANDAHMGSTRPLAYSDLERGTRRTGCELCGFPSTSHLSPRPLPPPLKKTHQNAREWQVRQRL